MLNAALIIVDVQNDFLPGGALAVPDGNEVIPVANRLQNHFEIIVATQDWHPANHGSFAANHAGKEPGDVIELDGLEQALWPVHCRQGTAGAEFESNLDRAHWSRVFPKGTDPLVDSYSGFFDNGHRKATGLDDFLKQRRVSHVFVLGLATEYCVKFTALDACELGFATFLVEDGCRGVELHPGDIEQALAEMKAAGVVCVTSQEILEHGIDHVCEAKP